MFKSYYSIPVLVASFCISFNLFAEEQLKFPKNVKCFRQSSQSDINEDVKGDIVISIADDAIKAEEIGNPNFDYKCSLMSINTIRCSKRGSFFGLTLIQRGQRQFFITVSGAHSQGGGGIGSGPVCSSID